MTITYAVSPLQVLLVGSVHGSASNGTCTDNALTGGGSCVVAKGVGTVTLNASKLFILNFHDWTGASCVSLANPLILTNPSADLACTANFGL